MDRSLRLGVNIDHVATVRNARGGDLPDPVAAALMAAQAGADGITAHLREDRRHILDRDIERLKAEVALPLNMEMAATAEMVAIALRVRPHAVCLVPERREERTTEGGLDVVGGRETLAPVIATLVEAGIRVSLFVEPDPASLEVAAALGAPVVELHTGAYCEAAPGENRQAQLKRLQEAARAAHQFGLECHAGHGLDFKTVGDVAAIPTIVELNIGHFLIGHAIAVGLGNAVLEMRRCMQLAR